MAEAEFFQSLGWIVVGAAICVVLARFARLPSIVACLGAGLLLGPAFGLVEDSEAFQHISEVGVVLLLFLVGLELSFDKIRDVGKVAVAAGLGQIVFTALGGMLFCWLLGFAWMDALFLSFALTFSSTVVAVKLLTDKGELNTLYGRIAVGNSLVQTLVVLVVLILINGLTGSEEANTLALTLEIAWSLGKVVLLLVGVMASAKYLLPIPFRNFASSKETIFIWALCWCFLVVGAANYLQLSVEIGALLAGLSLAQLPYNRDLQHRIKPLMNFFVAIFFVTLGIQVQLGEAMQSWGISVLLALFVLIGNTCFFLAVIPRFGYSERTSFCAGVTGAQISEFSFVFVSLGVATGLTGGNILAMTALIGIITIAVSAYFILYNGQLYEWAHRMGLLRPFMAKNFAEVQDLVGSNLSGHIIIVGMNRLGRRLAVRLHDKGEEVLAVDTDEKKLRGLPCPTLLGSTEYLDVLLDAGLPRAKLLISALRIEEANDLIAYRAKQFGVPCSIHAVDLSVVENLMDLDVDYLMLPKVDGVKLQTRYLKEEGFLKP